MKTNYAWLMVVFLLVAAGVPAAWAKPERLHIKDSNRQAKERVAKAQIKNIDLTRIEDPEARKALSEILNYLNLQAKK